MALYYPPNQIKPNLFANIGEFIFTSNQTPFSGSYHQLSNGKYYSGALHSNDSKEITQNAIAEGNQDAAIENSGVLPQVVEIISFTPINNQYSRITNSKIDVVKELPVNVLNLPTTEDYKIGEFTRYFAKKINEDSYIEFTKEVYGKLISKNPSIYYEQYIAFKLPWRLVGDKDKVYSTNKNITDLNIQKLNLFRFGAYLKFNYLKYYKFPNISNLYTSGSEFKTADGKNYIGPYHIHDSTGPMVGATHTKEPHGLLFPINETIISEITTQYNSQPMMSLTSSITSTTPIFNTNTGGGSFSGGSGGGGY